MLNFQTAQSFILRNQADYLAKGPLTATTSPEILLSCFYLYPLFPTLILSQTSSVAALVTRKLLGNVGFFEKLMPGDVIMADKRFNIQDLLALHETRLLARRIAKVRIHVERLIRKLKCFGILWGVIPLSMKPYISSIVKVCAALVNLQPSIVEDERH